MAEEWPQLRDGSTLREAVYQEVLSRLKDGWQEPGAFIREADIAEAMAVSRTPVREALGRLASEGWVERIPHRGFRIPERSLDDLVNLYPVLQALEVLAGELAFPNLDETALAELEAANGAFAEALERNAILAAVQLNDRFHAVVSEHCGNPVLQELLADLRGQVQRLELMDFRGVLEDVGGEMHRIWVEQHQGIIDAVRDGDFEEAQRLLYENRAIAYITGEGDGGPRQPAGTEATSGAGE